MFAFEESAAHSVFVEDAVVVGWVEVSRVPVVFSPFEADPRAGTASIADLTGYRCVLAGVMDAGDVLLRIGGTRALGLRIVFG